MRYPLMSTRARLARVCPMRSRPVRVGCATGAACWHWAAAGLLALAALLGGPEAAQAGDVSISIRTPGLRVTVGDRGRSFDRLRSKFRRSRVIRSPRFSRGRSLARSRFETGRSLIVISDGFVVVRSGDVHRIDRRRGFRDRRFRHRIHSRRFRSGHFRSRRLHGRRLHGREARSLRSGRYRGSRDPFVYRDGRRIRD